MADTAHKNPEDIVEHFDSEEVIQKKALQLINYILEANHFIIFTGAGISTSAGIPDFRGPEGAWTLAAQKKKRTAPTTSTLRAVPTPTHMALVELQNKGILKYIISQNCDGLHRKSGILPQNISELHGNTHKDYCSKCGKEYLRDFRTRNAAHVHDHTTGRKCDDSSCGGELYDSIINFGESLPEETLQRAYGHSYKADLCLVLGSSLTVSPACTLPEIVSQNGGKLVICNLQKTPLDKVANLKIHARCDDLMNRVMEGLGITIPPFLLTRRVIIGKSQTRLFIRGVDIDGTPYVFLKKVEVSQNDGSMVNLLNEPFETPVNDGVSDFSVKLHFMGHYNEPTTVIKHVQTGKGWKQYVLQFDPMTGIWEYFLEIDEDVEKST